MTRLAPEAAAPGAASGKLRQSPLFRPLRLAHLWLARRVVDLDRWLATTRHWILALVAFTVLQAALIATHRPWLDEWQALMIAVQSPDLATLFQNLRFEGHPAAWYVILRGLAEVLPDQRLALPIAAGLLAAAGQAAILLASPFSRAERLLTALSQFMLFEFFTISRSITLGTTVVLLAACLWQRRRLPWLLIAILPMCDFLYGVVSVAFVWRRWREKRWWWPGLLLWLGAGLFSAWTVRPAPGMVKAILPYDLPHGIASWIARVAILGTPFQGATLPQWNSAAPAFVAPLGLLLFMTTSSRELHDRREDWWPFACVMAATFIFSLVVYPLFPRHLMIIALLLVALVWLRLQAGGIRPSPLYRTWLVVCALCGVGTAVINAVIPFDTEDAAARAIVDRGLAAEHWMAFPDSRGEGVSALTGIVFERTETNCMQDSIRWNFRTSIETYEQFHGELERVAAREGRFYLLSDIHFRQSGHLIVPIASIPAGYDGYPYYLYAIHPERERKPHAALPLCNGPVRPLRRK